MTQWTKLQNCISGTGFERKTMVTSLCALFMAADPRLLSLTVPVEVVASEKNSKGFYNNNDLHFFSKYFIS